MNRDKIYPKYSCYVELSHLNPPLVTLLSSTKHKRR